jgi:hypothetical protein
MSSLKDRVHEHLEEFAKHIVETYPHRTPEQNDALTKAFEQFEDELVDGARAVAPAQHHASQVANLLVEIYSSAGMTRQKALSFLLENKSGAAMLNRLSVNKSDSEEDLLKMATDNQQFVKALSTLGNDTENGFVEQTRKFAESIGKTFVELYTADDDLGIELRKKRVELRDKGFAEFHARNYPRPYPSMTAEQAQDAIAKAWPRVETPKPITRDSLSGVNYDIEGATEDQKRMYREIQQSAPWLSAPEIYARLKAQIVAREQINNAKLRRQLNRTGSLRPIKV